MATTGVIELGADRMAKVIKAVREFEEFNEGNDPYEEHDFGAVEVEAIRISWKIDYYDNHFTYQSPDPANPEVTERVLTIMLASEY